jgi:hypothetical protein
MEGLVARPQVRAAERRRRKGRLRLRAAHERLRIGCVRCVRGAVVDGVVDDAHLVVILVARARGAHRRKAQARAGLGVFGRAARCAPRAVANKVHRLGRRRQRHRRRLVEARQRVAQVCDARVRSRRAPRRRQQRSEPRLAPQRASGAADADQVAARATERHIDALRRRKLRLQPGKGQHNHLALLPLERIDGGAEQALLAVVG